MENKVLCGDVKFSRNEDAQELLRDVLDQIRPFTSMGFDILSIEEIAPEDMPEDLKNKCLSIQCPAYKVTSWRPYEGSSVPLEPIRRWACSTANISRTTPRKRWSGSPKSSAWSACRSPS